MIPQIKEVNFGPNTANDYATLHQATVNLSTMGDRTITTQVRIDGDVVPDFTGWELEFRGERFILPTREPQARKDNTTKNSLIDLTFYSWPVYELKRYFFVEMSSTTSGTAIADKYDASLALNLENFVDAFNLVLDHYFNGRIQISLFGQGQGIYSTDPVFFEINYTKLWEVLQKVYEMYNVRWWFDYDSASDIYLIKMGYTADSIDDHDFSYGYKGGLLSFERTVQSDDLVNILLGRGGEKNLPYRYFKRTDPDNPGWTADPDAIPELANIYFDRLHDINFRWYVRGWMTNPTPNRDRSWEQEGYVYPTYSISPDSPYYFAYQKGATDAKFNPVEYVKDDESIAAHGEVWGALDDNDDIYPTIQGVTVNPYGRIDESVAISQIETDDISAYASAAAVETTIKDMKVSLSGNNVLTHTIYSEPFTIAQGETGNVTYRPFSKETVYPNFVYYDTTRSTLVAEPLSGGSDQSGTASYDEATGLYAVSGLPAGTYRLKLNLVLRVDRPAQLATGTFGIENVVLTTSAANTNAWKPTFDIWVKNLWQTTQGTNESNKDYAERVWGPILGDRLGDEAKIVFSTGAMSISQDYEFVIADYPVPDRTKTLNGVPSEWKITVYKSDAEYQATGLYIPNASSTQPLAGDKFFFVGIDMPFQYVEWAEERLNQYKTDNLEGMAEISPTWTLKLDKVRINSLEDEDYGQKLADRLDAGVMIRTTDPRFTHGDILSLYIQSITWTWNEPSKGSPYIVPDVEVILADKVSAVESPISRLENDVDVISQTYVQSGDVEAVVRRVAGALFLKKTGESDSSSSPTTFSSKVTSRNFRKGGIGGAGWGLYEDNSRKFSQSSPATRADVSDEEETVEPRTVLEVDRLVVREEMEVNNLVINQISARGGREIISAARIETTLVRETSTSYVCYFDQKQNSVANLFRVNDIAYGQVWSPDNMELRFYKMLVTAVDVNSITLAKAGRYGSGAPQEGDVIVQYGNTSDARRQYVIIRDVVGGGHDRMLSGLNSVSAEGVEYYYAGVETGDTPRWFVGDREAEYAEYKDGVLNIKGQLSVLKSDGSYQAMSDYIDQINANETNLQNQIDNNIQSWSASASPLPISDGGTVDPTTANYPASQWEDDETRLKHVGDIYTDETSGQSYRYTRLPNDGDFYWMRISDEEAAQALQQANQALQGLAGLNYLKAATNNGTTLVDGGLILSNLIALGKTEEDVFNIYSGINGIMDPNAYGNGIAAWYGGPMTDHEAEPTEALYANSLFRFDGSGYLAGGLLKWGLDNGAAFLTLNGQAVVGGLGGTTLNDIANLLFDVVQYKTGHYAVKLRPNAYYGGNLVAIDGLYAEGWVSAGGVSDQGGGGGGTGYLRDLLDVNASMSPTQGQALVWDDALGKWTAGDVSVDLTPFERIANRVTTVSASSNHTQYPTAKAVYDIVNTMLSSAMRFQGVTSTALVDGSTTNPVIVDGASYTATRGDVVVRSDVGLEYLWTGARWQQLGDETSYAKKTVTITGSGYLTGGGNLEAARTIDIAEAIKTKIDNGATAFSYFTDGAANEAIKLRTARKLWGQNFDGSADVSGILTGVNTDNTTGIGTAITIGCPSVDGLSAVGNGVGITMGISGESYYTKIATVFEDSNPRYLQPALAFYTMYNSYEAGSEVERMRISANGNVGFGTPSPAHRVDIAGDSRISGKVYIGTSGGYLEVVNVGTTASPVYALKSSLPFFSDSWVSAGGVSSTGSGGGITGYLKDLLDVNGSMIPVDGQALVWDSSLGDNGRWTSKNVSVDLTPFERTINKVTSISASSTDGQYPSARAVYNAMGNYLPLTGGMLNGSSGISASPTLPLRLFNPDPTGDTFIGLSNGTDDIKFGLRGPYSRFGLTIVDPSNNYYKVWHEGNDGSGSGLDADLLDGKHNGELTARACGPLAYYGSEGTTVADCKAWLAQIFSDSGLGVGDNCYVGTSYIDNWGNDSATYDPSSVHSFIKIGGGYSGVNYGQWLLSSYADNRIGYVGRNANQWTNIKWLANTEDIDSCAKIAEPNNLIHSGNEFTFIPPNHNNNIWFNYRTTDLSLSGNVTGYYFGNGQGSALAYITAGQFSGNAASTTKLQTTRSIWGQPFDGTRDVSGDFLFDGGDATLKIYDVPNPSQAAILGHESVVIQTSFDQQDPETGTYPELYPDRVVLSLQPRGGYVGIGTAGPAYKLDVTGDARATGKVYIGTSGGYLEVVTIDGVPMLHTTLPFYSDSFVSAGGLSGTDGSGSGSSLRDLSDVHLPETITTGSALVYDGEKWVQSDAAFVPQTRTINGLELSSDISLSLGDLSNVNTAGASNGLSLMYNDGEWTPGRAARVFYGTCSTGASATNKIVNCEGFTTADLVAGTIVIVYFTNASDKRWGNATLQVGATNAVNIWNASGWLTWDAGETVPFYYCPHGWQIGTTKGYTAAHGYNLPVADADTFGAVRIAYTHGSSESISINSPSTTAGRYYYVESNGLGRLFVNVPWTGGGSGGGGSYSAGTGISITNNTISVIKATTANLGGVLPAAVRSSTPTLITGETESNRYYGVEMNSSGQLFVNVPWTGGSGSASWGTTSKNTSPLTVGGTTKTVMLAGAATARNASPIINTGGTTANRYYGVELSNDGKLFVNVPWLEGGGSTGAYLPIAGGTMEGTINSQSVIAKSNNAYDLGSSGKYYANTYTKKIYLDDGVYIYYDSTNRVIRVQGAGIAATGSVNAGGVSNT